MASRNNNRLFWEAEDVLQTSTLLVRKSGVVFLHKLSLIRKDYGNDGWNLCWTRISIPHFSLHTCFYSLSSYKSLMGADHEFVTFYFQLPLWLEKWPAWCERCPMWSENGICRSIRADAEVQKPHLLDVRIMWVVVGCRDVVDTILTDRRHYVAHHGPIVPTHRPKITKLTIRITILKTLSMTCYYESWG